jgi:GNAT superfamily N-acetyltransferase
MMTLFSGGGLHARELRAHEVPLLQDFFEANPEYFRAVNGRDPRPGDAQLEFDELPPPHLAFGRRWIAGLFDERGQLAGLAIVLSDFVVARVWHLALFIVATHRHGSGTGSAVYRALEDWLRGQQAQWLRLGVVQGNARAERFWQRHGFVEARQRPATDASGRSNTIRVLVKPLFTRPQPSLADYLAAMPRDEPGSMLP